MAAGKKVRGEDMCEAMAERSTGPSKYLCAGLFVGRCRLVRQMFNHVDDVVKQDLLNVENPFFDQALYQIMMLRYPELNLQGRKVLLFLCVVGLNSDPGHLRQSIQK